MMSPQAMSIDKIEGEIDIPMNPESWAESKQSIVDAICKRLGRIRTEF